MDLSFDHVTKFYGPVIGVNDISCRIGPGITGLLGSNGAGKSTLIKLASGQLRPTQGRVLLGEHDAWSTAAKQCLGYCPDVNNFYEEMTGREFVYAMTALYGFPLQRSASPHRASLEEVGMSDLASRRLAGSSHGMRQRIKLARALVNDPPILLLDEPLLGVDPGGRRAINDLLLELASSRQDDSRLQPHPGRNRTPGRYDFDDCPRSVDCFGHAGRSSQPARRPATGRRDRFRRSRRLASMLVGFGEVQSVELGDEQLLVRTSHPARFFASLNELVLHEELEIERLQTLDAGADAIFGYLEQGSA